MQIKKLLSTIQKIKKIKKQYIIDNNYLTITYNLINSYIYVKINYLDQDCHLELHLNEKGELILDLTNDRELVKMLHNKSYMMIIQEIFNQEI